jgi:hypothetical protein
MKQSLAEISGSISNGSLPAATPSVTLASLSEATTPTSTHDSMKLNFFRSLKLRGFDTFCLLNANDADVFDFIQVATAAFFDWIFAQSNRD